MAYIFNWLWSTWCDFMLSSHNSISLTKHLFAPFLHFAVHFQHLVALLNIHHLFKTKTTKTLHHSNHSNEGRWKTLGERGFWGGVKRNIWCMATDLQELKYSHQFEIWWQLWPAKCILFHFSNFMFCTKTNWMSYVLSYLIRCILLDASSPFSLFLMLTFHFDQQWGFAEMQRTYWTNSKHTRTWRFFTYRRICQCWQWWGMFSSRCSLILNSVSWLCWYAYTLYNQTKHTWYIPLRSGIWGVWDVRWAYVGVEKSFLLRPRAFRNIY